LKKPKPPAEPTDEELDRYIMTRYSLIGIDISVLPESDENAPMDRRRLLGNGRSILRQDAIAADFEIDPQFNLPVTHPAPFVAWTDESGGSGR
jgi:hypothetical protein|tara:strand:+ start:193 stop:471 length:279 start_codon:yes stop_codon:yes gene_type:complete